MSSAWLIKNGVIFASIAQIVCAVVVSSVSLGYVIADSNNKIMAVKLSNWLLLLASMVLLGVMVIYRDRLLMKEPLYKLRFFMRLGMSVLAIHISLLNLGWLDDSNVSDKSMNMYNGTLLVVALLVAASVGLELMKR